MKLSRKSKEDSFESVKNANASSSSIEENVEIYEEDNEDDDEPIEALIRGKVRLKNNDFALPHIKESVSKDILWYFETFMENF